MKSILKETGVFELKQTEKDSIAFNAVADHQKKALMQVKHNVFFFKIPDVGYQNPFDCFCFNNAQAYVVIKYPDICCMIDIDDWVLEESISDRKSLTSQRAKEIATIIFK